MKWIQVAAATALAAGMAACEPSQKTEAPPLEASSIPDRGSYGIKRGEGAESTAAADATNIEVAVTQVMTQQYGNNFNPALGCWEYTTENNGESYTYCMKPGKAELVATDDGSRLYFFAASRSDIKGNLDYLYGHTDLGLMGAFELQPSSSGGWSVVSASNDLGFGSIGNCGCEDAKLVKLGKNYYGWMFISGGVWQGVPSLYHNIVAPRDGKFIDLSEIPWQTEELGDAEYRIKIDDSNAAEAMFPLVVTKFDGGREAETTRVDFDPLRQRYFLQKK